MSFAGHLRSRVWECAFLALASCGLAYTACSGFYATQPFQEYPWAIALICAGMSAVLECIAYTKRTALAGGIAFAFAVAVSLAVCMGQSPVEMPLDDVEGNLVLVALMLIVPTVAAFLLSRTRPGAFVLLVGGALFCGLIEYLYWYGHLAALGVFFVGAVGLVVVSGYRKTLGTSDEGTLSFGPVALVACALAAIALLVGAGVFFAIIEPLDPPSQQVKLLVEDRRVNEIYLMGTGASVDDATGEGGSLWGDDQEKQGEDGAPEEYDGHTDSSSDQLGMNDDQTGDAGTTTMMSPPSYLALVIAGSIILLVVIAVLLKKLQRSRRFARMTSGGNEQTALGLYQFFLERMEKAGLVRPASLSLSEYVQAANGALVAFEGGADGKSRSVFSLLTDVYTRTLYGRKPVSDAEAGAFVAYYRTFYRNVRKQMGAVRYLARYFFM